jgi:imidazolonepropionase-like amidohydrolase
MEAGMPAMETIQSATIEAARLLRLDEDLGSIQTGKIADIVATPENPLDNIQTMESVAFVMKAGVVYKMD